ncbi:hypothetical protein LG275_13260 [Chryseomicrobium palamuruense]
MIFCTECGEKNNSNNEYCGYCGKALLTKNNVQGNSKVVNEPISQRNNRSPLSKKQKILFTTIGVLALSALGTHFFAKSHFSHQNKVEDFITSIQEGNTNSFYSHLTIPEKAQYDKQIYFDYVQSLDTELLKTEFNTAYSDFDSSSIFNSVKVNGGYDSADLFTLTQKKKFGIYNELVITPVTGEMIITSDFADINYSFLGKSGVLTSNELILNNILPGTYSITLSSNATDFKSDFSTTIHSNLPGEVDLSAQQFGVTLDTGFSNGKIFFNDQDTGYIIYDYPILGPVSADQEVEIRIDIPDDNGEIVDSITKTIMGPQTLLVYNEEFEKANSLLINTFDSNSLETESSDEELGEKLEKLFFDFRSAYEDALNSQDFTMVEAYLLPNSLAYKDTKEFIENSGTEAYEYYFSHNEVIAFWSEGDFELIDTYEEFVFTNHLNESIFYERFKTYYFEYDNNNELKISGISIDDTNRSID